MAAAAIPLSPTLEAKLRILQQKLGADDLDSALDKSLNIANFVADTVSDPQSKLLLKTGDTLQEINGIV